MSFLLLATIFTPLLGLLVLWIVSPNGSDAVRSGAMLVSLITMIMGVVLVSGFPSYQPTEAVPHYAATDLAWLSPSDSTESPSILSKLDVRFNVGLDGLSVWMFGLSTILVFTSVLVSWNAIKDRPAGFYALLLLLETGMLGVFAARDIILFYVFFEFTLIPLFFLIGIWGSEQRRYAAIKFFLFTLAGSVLTFIGLLAIVIWNYQHSATGVMTFSIDQITQSLSQISLTAAQQETWQTVQCWIFVALFAGFAIKVPLFPLHTWLPLAHVQAPTAGSVLLAGVLLKIGTYGFIRFSIPMLPDATAIAMPWILWLSTAGIIYGALVALAQKDIKRLIAYSSVSHLGFCMLGIFALNRLGMQGGVLQMINHGLSTGGLFAIVGMLYERYHTRKISDYSGIAKKLPILTFFMLVFTFSSIGLPGLNGFAGEFPILLGMFQRAWEVPADGMSSDWAGIAGQLKIISVLALSGVVLGAWYMLWLVKRVFFGPLKEPTHSHDSKVQDLCGREILALSPLVVLIVWIGVQPHAFLQPMNEPLNSIVDEADQTLNQHYQIVDKQTDNKKNIADTTASKMKKNITENASLVKLNRHLKTHDKREQALGEKNGN